MKLRFQLLYQNFVIRESEKKILILRHDSTYVNQFSFYQFKINILLTIKIWMQSMFHLWIQLYEEFFWT